MSTKRLFRLLAMLPAIVFGLMITATRAYAEGSVYINADKEGVKIGDFYYDLNTKTHKAAVTYEVYIESDLMKNYNYIDLTSADIPSEIIYKNEKYTVVEITSHAFDNCPTLTHISIPTSVVYIGAEIFGLNDTFYFNNKDCWWDNADEYHQLYIDNCLITGFSSETITIDKPGTRVIAESSLTCEHLVFNKGEITLSGDVLDERSYYGYHLKDVTLWGARIHGYFEREEGSLNIYNYGGKIDYTDETYNSLNTMYVTRDVASLHPAKKWKDKVKPFRFFSGSSIRYELLNEEEAVVVKDDSYASWYKGKIITIPNVTRDIYRGYYFRVGIIEPEAFAGTLIGSVTLPGTIKEVPQGCFSGCTSLEEVIFTYGQTTIHKQAFMGCTALRELNLNQVANIASEAFKGCTELTTLFTDYNGVINAHSLAFDGLDKGNITVQVPNDLVDKYKADAFWKDFNIVSNRRKVDGLWYEISGNTAKLVKEKSGEDNYPELAGKVTVPKDVVIEGEYYTVTSIEPGALQYVPMTELDVRAQVTTIPEKFCYLAKNLRDISLPETVIKIENNAFAGTNIESIALPNSLTTIGDEAFSNCWALKDISLPNSLTTIGYGAFSFCRNMNSVEIPSNVTTIGVYAFGTCSSLTIMINHALTPQPFSARMLTGVDKDKLEIQVEYGALNAFKTAEGWKDYKIIASPVVYAYNDEESGLSGRLSYWIDKATHTAILTVFRIDNNPDPERATVEIPETIKYDGEEITVTGIDERAFERQPVKKVILPETIEKIGSFAFQYSEVEEVQLPEHIVLMGDYVFHNCEKLTKVNLPKNLTILPEFTFTGCKALETVVLPDGLQKIDFYSLGNTKLSSVTIPENVTYIENLAFRDCTNLYEIYNLASTPQTIIADVFKDLTLKDINLYVLPGCKDKYAAADVWKEFNIKEMSVQVGDLSYRINPSAKTAQVTYDDMANTYKSLSGKVTVPASITYKGESYAVTGIYNYAFQRNTTITEIVLPKGIKTIGWDCFDKMTKLTSLNIPSTVETMDRFGSNGITANEGNYKNGLLIIDNCLIDAKKDLDYIVHVPDGTRLIAGSAFQNCKNIIEINIPESVKEIGNSAFSGCKSLGQITLPEGLKVLRKNVFFGCESIGLFGLNLPESLEEIEEWAFGYNCKSLREVRIPAGVRKIGKMAFQSSAIRQLWLPEGIQEIGNTAFAFLDLLEDVYCYAPDPSAITLGTNVFQNFQEGAKLHVPYGSAGLYAAAEQWKDFDFEEMTPCIDGFYYILDKMNQTATVTYELVSDMYSNYTKLNSTRWNIPAKVALDGIVYDVKNIGEKAFYHTNVAIVVLPEGLESIDDDAFADTYEHFVSLTAVVLPSTLTSIGEFAFYNQRNLKEIYNYATTPQDISGKGVFGDGTYGTIDKSKIRLYVPYGSKAAYEADDEWKDFDIVEMSVCIDGVYYALNEENGTASVTYQYFDDERNYADLRRDLLTIPSEITVDDKAYKVTSIGDGAFAHSKNIQVIVLPEGLKSIKDSAFGGSALLMVCLPSTLTEIDPWTFAYCENPVMLRNFATEPLEVADFKYFTKGILEVPAGCKAAYEAADVWKDFTIREMAACIDGIYYSLDDETGNATVITDYTGHSYSLLGEEIELPEMITVGENAYTVTHINNLAFYGNTVLTKLTLSEMLSTINPQAFSGCTSLRTIINHRTAPTEIDATVFDGLSKSACTLFVHRESVEAYKSADEWKDFNIVSIETPIMIAGQPIRSDMYGKPLTGIKGAWGVVVTSSGIYLGGGGSIYTEDVPAIELYADGNINTFFIGGENAHLNSTGSPAIRVNGNTPVTLNINTHLNGEETTEGLDLRIDSDSEDGAIAFANGMEATLNINSLGGASTNGTFIVATNAPIGIPPSAYCDIHAAGVVDLVSNNDICPIGVFNTSNLTLHSTTMVLPFGGEIKEEGIFDAYGNDCFRLRLAPIYTQSGKAYPVELAGMTVTGGNKEDILGNGKASYEPLTNTLTLNNVNVTDTCGQVLHATAGLRLEVKGKNNLFSTSGRPSVEVQGGDFVIFGSKDSELDITGENGVQCDETEQYRMEVKRCSVDIGSWGGEFGLQADSLCVNAGNLIIGAYYNGAPAWRSWNTAEDGGLVLKHANKTYGKVNADELVEIVRQDPLLFKVDVATSDESQGTVTGGGWYEDGTEITLTATANEGFKFVRWDDDVTDNPRLLTVDDDMTLTAIFADRDKFIVTFVGFNGVTLGYDEVYAGEDATAPDPQTPEGWHFIGWDTDFTNVQSSLTVTAQYEKNVYTVTFIGFDGETVLDVQQVAYGEAAVAPLAPEVEHYTCTGWDKDFSYITSDLVVRAIYEPKKYDVSFFGMGGVWIMSQQVEYGGTVAAPAAPYVEDYNFVGWLSSASGDLMSSEEVNAAIVTGDISYTAQYESTVKTYSLKLEVEGNGKLYFGIYNAFGELQEAEATESEYNLPEGSQFILIAKPDEGWLFAQWNDGLTRDRRNITLTSDLSLKAIFTEDPDGINSLAGTNSETNTKIMHKGKLYILRDGKVFTADGYEVSRKRLGR